MFENVKWSDEETQVLKDFWSAGKTASEIANALSTKFKRPFNRNGVIGKAHRIGLTKRPNPIKRRKETSAAEIPVYLEQPITIIPDEKHCHFVSGDDDKKIYCSKPATHKAYCEEHYNKMHVPKDLAKRMLNPFS